MTAFIVRAIKKVPGLSFEQNLASLAQNRLAIYKTPVIADDTSEALEGFTHAHGETLEAYSIASEVDIKAMMQMVEKSAQAAKDKNLGYLLFGLPKKDSPYTNTEVMAAFKDESVVITYVNTSDFSAAQEAAGIQNPTTMYFSGFSHLELSLELKSLDDLARA